MRVAFNEISINEKVETVEAGKLLIENFLFSYIKLRELGLNDSIISKYTLDGILLASDYPIQKWRNDSTIDIELKRVYKRLNDKLELNEEFNECEFICQNGKKSFGCLEAHKNQGVTISFASEEIWRINSVIGKIFELLDEEIIEEDVSVINIFSKKSVDDNKEYIINAMTNRIKEIDNGIELWNKRNELFPYLDFCINVKEQLCTIERTHLNQVIKKLIILNDYFQKWDCKEFEKERIAHCTPESPTTLRYYKEEHTFSTFDGRRIVFSWHIRYTGNIPGRIFFDADRQAKKGIVGHIGVKLPTVSDGNH